MDDIVSELTAQALSQITEGHDIGNDSIIEDSTPTTTVPLGDGIQGEISRVEQARQEFRDALADADNSFPPNTFEETLRPLSQEEEELLAAVLENEHHEIPENSATITVDETTSRFSGAIWYEQIRKQTVTLAGVGGIGSYVGFLLGRLKPERLIVYDPDKVEAVNMSGQLYGKNDLGTYKGVALASMVKNYADYYNMVIHPERFTTESEATDIMICGFDNMSARKLFYNKWKSHISGKTEEEKAKCLFIDGRLAAEEFQVLSIQGNDNRAMAEYEDKWLFNDAEAEETICSYKQTTFMANMIASIMVNVFVNFIANQCGPIIDRDVPFFISYDASTMFTKVVM